VDYRPGSPDLPRVIGAMHQSAAISCPDLPVKQARQRWAAYVDREAAWTCWTAMRCCTPTSTR